MSDTEDDVYREGYARDTWGEGPVSNCCGAAPLGEIFEGFAMCSDCKEQAEFKEVEE